jgi:hypothetical protein
MEDVPMEDAHMEDVPMEDAAMEDYDHFHYWVVDPVGNGLAPCRVPRDAVVRYCQRLGAAVGDPEQVKLAYGFLEKGLKLYLPDGENAPWNGKNDLFALNQIKAAVAHFAKSCTFRC